MYSNKKKKVSDKINIKQIVGLGAGRGMGDEMADPATHVQGHHVKPPTFHGSCLPLGTRPTPKTNV